MKINDFIANIPLFKGLPQEHIARLSEIAQMSSFKRGQVIFSSGDKAEGFYVVRLGRVKIFQLSPEGKEQILHIIGQGEPFGEVPVFAGETFPAHAEAMEETQVVFFPRNAFEELFKKDPSIAINMLAVLSRRLRQFTQLVETLSLKEVPQRLATYLLYGECAGLNTHDTLELEIAKGQLASILGTIPETLSRILNKMAAQGLIKVNGRKITLGNKKELYELASGHKTLL